MSAAQRATTQLPLVLAVSAFSAFELNQEFERLTDMVNDSPS